MPVSIAVFIVAALVIYRWLYPLSNIVTAIEHYSTGKKQVLSQFPEKTQGEIASLANNLKEIITQIAENQTRFDSVLDTVSTAIVTITEHGIIESFNESAQRIFGYSADEVIGKNVKMLMPEEHKYRHDSYLQKYQETAKASIIGVGRELVGVRKNGEQFPLFLHVGQVDLEHSRVFTGVMEDLSKLKASEATERETRRQLEQQARQAAEQKTRLESIVNTVGTAIITITEKGIVESFNESAQRIFGYHANEVIGKNIKMLMPDEHRYRHDNYLQKYRETAKASIIGAGRELVGVRKNGERFPLFLHVGQVDLEHSRVFTGVMEDLSKLNASEAAEQETRRQLELQARQAAEQRTRLESIVDTVGTAIITITDRGIVESFNEAAQTIFGYSSTEILGQNVKMLMPGEHKHQHDSYLKKYKDTGIASIIGTGRQLTGVRKNGQEFPMFLHVGQVKLENRTIFTGAIEDLTDIKEAQLSEQKIRETLEQEKIRLQEQDWLKTALGQINMSLHAKTRIEDFAQELLSHLMPLIDAQLGVFYLLETAGSEQPSLKNYGSYGYSHTGNKQQLQTHIAFGEGLVGSVAQRGKTVHLTDVPDSYVHRIRSALGDAAPRQVIIIPILFKNKPLAVLEIASLSSFTELHKDLLKRLTDSCAVIINGILAFLSTEQLLARTQEQSEQLQRNEEELKASNEELARQSAEAEERNRQLEEMQAELEETSRYKSEFLANMSHELRTPLNSLLILAKLLSDNEDGNLSENQLKSAATIHSSGNDLLNLINDILDLSKVEAGQMQMDVRDVPYSGLARELEASFTPVANERGLDFTITLHDELPKTIATDEQRLSQILRNFLSNAFKFTKSGSVSLTIQAADDISMLRNKPLKQQGAIAFTVTDTGIGIAQDKQDMIFLAFQQVDSSVQREYGGTGLGLSISRQLADLLEGEIHVSSTADKGSTFTLYLPAALAKNSAILDQAKTTLAMPGRKNNLTNTTVPDDRDHLHQDRQTILLLEDDPKFALIVAELVHESGFNILISNDGEDGYLLAKEFQPIGIILDLMLIGLSGQSALSRLKDDPTTRHIPVHIVSGTGNIEEVKGQGIVGFLQKPASKEQLLSIMNRFKMLATHPMQQLLLVEDDELQSRHIRDLLGNHDMQVTTAKTAGEAIKQLKNTAFDCMVLDLKLPDMDGLKLLQSLSGDDVLEELPIIVYTAKSLNKQETEQLNSYANSIITKSEKGSEKLLNEVVLFLHRMEINMPERQRSILRKIHDVEAILDQKTVLLVDDDMRNIYAMSASLENKNMQVVIAKNGKQALEQLATHKTIDIVLMDIMMPEMDGYEAMRRIRQQKCYKNLPIIALTAKAMSGDREQCIEAGASDYISKPIEVERLFSLMRVWLY